MARWARSRGGGGEGRGRAPQPFRGSSPSPALARPLARARALPSGSSSLPGPAGRCAFAPFPRYLGRRTPPPPRRSSSVCHRSCPNALTSPRCRRPRPARKRGGERRRWGACAGWAEPGPRSLLQGGLGCCCTPGRRPWLAPRAQVFLLFCPLYPWEEPPVRLLGLITNSVSALALIPLPRRTAGPWLPRAGPGCCSFSACSLWGLFPHPSPHPPRKRRG